MEQCYAVNFEDKKVGTVYVHPEGLYYIIRCRIKIPGKRVYLRTSKTVVDLGICVPMEGGYGFDIRKAIKSVPGMVEEFFLSEKKTVTSLCLINPAQPFAPLSCLNQGKLCMKGGKHYLLVE